MKAKMKKVLKSNKGFTMIELMVVIVIMLILAAIAIPSFSRLVTEANTTAATAEARTVLMLAQLEADTMAIDGTSIDDIQTALNADTQILTDAGLESDADVSFTVDADGSVNITYKSGTITVELP